MFLVISLPGFVMANGFKFRIRNTTKNPVSVFYRLNRKGGKFRVKSLMTLKPGEEKIKEITVSKEDTISFYGQNAEDQTSAIVRKDYRSLESQKDGIFLVSIVIPEKENASFESLENLSTKLERNKVLNFLLKMDSSSMSSMSMLENNFQNIYPLGTFIFVDTKTNRLLIPPLEPSFWNNSETYLTIQDSLYDMVNKNRQTQAGAQIGGFVARLFDSLRVGNTEELEFKARLSLLRWKPAANANIYQIINDKSFHDFLQNCYDQIDNPDVEYGRYRLYFLSSYERIDDLEIYGKQFYSFGNEADLSLMSSPQFQLFSTNLGMLYSKNRTMSNYFSVQNAVLRTKAYDFTSLLFNGFKNNIKSRLREEEYQAQHREASNIIGEYKTLVDYNPDPVRLNLMKLNEKDTTAELTPILTTVADLTPFTYMAPDTSKQAIAANKNVQVESYNNKARIFNSHLKEINTLIKQLDETNTDIVKMSGPDNDAKYMPYAKNSPGLLNEIIVSNKIVQKE
ncbi:MAG: hypothetical protein JSU01_04920 [Bacteroidetes bacterium]|nr:hypothetical protein [Bacteroidota bacterium]